MAKKFFQKMGLIKEEEEVPPEPAVQKLTPTTTFFNQVPQTQSFNSKTDWAKHLEELLENQPEKFNFQKFLSSITKMDSNSIPENTRFITAFSVAQALGMSAQDLINSGNSLIKILDNENSEFQQSINNAQIEKIQNRQSEIESLIKENSELTAKINTNSIKIQELNVEVQTNQSSLNVESSAFTQAYNNKKQLLEEALTKFKTYIK